MRVRRVDILVPVLALLAASPGVETRQDWVTVSNGHTRLVLEALAKFDPEFVSREGLTEFDGLVTDLGPDLDGRQMAAIAGVSAELEQRLAASTDPNVRQDLQILLDSTGRFRRGIELQRRYELAWVAVPQLVFGGIRGLLNEEVAAARRGKALERLRRYVGQYPGTTAMTELAKARFAERPSADRLGPFRGAVAEALAQAPTYAAGIRDLFAEYGITGGADALDAMDEQFADYVAWARATVLPRARDDFRQPDELYAFRLEDSGIDVDPDELIERARVSFMEIRAAMVALAPLVADQKGLDGRTYPEVIRQLKRDVIPDSRLESHYADVNRQLEAIIRREGIVDVPARPMVMRLASPAESAAQPAPHMQTPPLVGNTGERGQFVLPVGNPSGDAGAYDDFNFPSAAWTLSAHEGRPGHELQFSAMVERGVSQARSLFAFNSVNVEGWALYAEAEMQPYEPIDGQLITLQFRLLRAARAMLDPLLNLGRITVDEARRILADEVVLSPAMTRQELDRYTFRAPGQAGSYFYGYTRLLSLRAETELALGGAFDRLAFNNFLLAQGLLPPDLLADAVRQEFIPAHQPATR